MTHTLLWLPLVLSGPVELSPTVTIFGVTTRSAPAPGGRSLADEPKPRDNRLALGSPAAITAAGANLLRHLDVTLTEVDAAEVARLIGDSLPASVRDRFKGRVGKVFVQVRGDMVTVKAEKFRLAGDWLARAEGTADLKTRKFTVKMWAFGGLMEAEGTLPKE